MPIEQTRLKRPAIFRGWQSVEAVWLSWAHQNEQSTLIIITIIIIVIILCIYTRFLFLFSFFNSSWISGIQATIKTIVSTIQIVIFAKSASSKHSPHCSRETELKLRALTSWWECVQGFVCVSVFVWVNVYTVYSWELCRNQLPVAKCHCLLCPSGCLHHTVQCCVQGTKVTSGARLTMKPNAPAYRWVSI